MRPLLPLLLVLLGACASVGPAPDRLSAEDPALAGALALNATTPAELPRLIASHEATVLVWWATACPCVRRYHARIEAVAATWTPRGVAVVAVSSNADDSPEILRAAAAERALSLPLVLDPGGALALSLRVVSTPSVVVLDREGRVRFHGWIDNEREPGTRGRQAWLDDALEAVLAGREVPVARSPAWGCTITRSLGGGGRCIAAPAPDGH